MTDQAQQAHPRQRRRGEELETAILDAAWQELVDVGFAKLTMESIAARAKTGVAVLYRRWPNKDDLVLAAIRHYGTTHPVEIPDTGNLRDDMIAILNTSIAARVGFATVVSATFSGLLTSAGLTPAEVREKVLTPGSSWSEGIYARAQERGEINLATTPAAVLTMPFDLMRHELLMTHKPIPAERIAEIVDDLFMPLVRLNRAP
ncbi:TetR/AcrR family transcriptional regulator [Catenulispora sp. NF23]|uniref:TetR/AcrR family transcriptional regulator n=1 Tax=Catenulispora pinistramenti TaxID=2705254 RepID=A0ABS5KVP8_9ACTN|nr:TetR/AcrR family transcriptional regulator [Catenulispora pinistramenti]MBS2537267.1 TetR/AcrR family transcriptional regulator [Catenulispora pinistramenti]MBS2550146.1 TetR/AcrR family transcriptional regulator [Catenulispora pinistramenti]